MTTFKDIADLLVSGNISSDLTFLKICLALGIDCLISFYIFLVYQKYSQNEFYSKNFNISLALMSIITTGIILAMQSNLVISLGMVGALSIIRYRTAIKSSMDLFFLFWSISVGIICGAQQYILALLMTLLTAVFLIFLSKFDWASKLFMLIVKSSQKIDLKKLENALKKNTKFIKLKSQSINKSETELIFEFIPRKDTELSDLLSKEDNIDDFQIISNG